MAGYRSGANYKNATLLNDQIDRQREAINTRNRSNSVNSSLGISSNLDQIFPKTTLDARTEIFQASVGVMNDLDSYSTDSVVAGDNPDFPVSVRLNNRANIGTHPYGQIDDSDNRPVDMPNRKGPNLVVPDINILSENGDVETSATAPVDGGYSDNNKGFGWRDARNDPQNFASRIGTYFSRHYSTESESGDRSASPIFGEAKSPVDDEFIDYDQP